MAGCDGGKGTRHVARTDYYCVCSEEQFSDLRCFAPANGPDQDCQKNEDSKGSTSEKPMQFTIEEDRSGTIFVYETWESCYYDKKRKEGGCEGGERGVVMMPENPEGDPNREDVYAVQDFVCDLNPDYNPDLIPIDCEVSESGTFTDTNKVPLSDVLQKLNTLLQGGFFPSKNKAEAEYFQQKFNKALSTKPPTMRAD